jgi:hypothetical protein
MNLLIVYATGTASAMVVLIVTACKLGRCHGMTPLAMSLVTILASVVWPLLVIAFIQIGIFVGFARCLRSIGLRTGQDASPTKTRLPSETDLATAA